MFFKFPCKINSLNFAHYIIIVVKLRLTALFHTHGALSWKKGLTFHTLLGVDLYE